MGPLPSGLLVFTILAFLGFGVANGTIACADCEFHYCEVFYPTQGMPVFAQPTYSSAGQLFYNYAPKIYTIHVFQMAGNQRVVGILKVLKPGILSNLVVEITNLGMEMECFPLYSFEAFALFTGVPPPMILSPVRILPCPRVWMLDIEISPLGNMTEYTVALKKFSTELLHLKKVGIIMDIYKYLGRLPATFLVLGCGTPTFYDQLTMSFASLAGDYGAVAIGRVHAMTKWNPLIGGKGGSCFWGNAAASMFPMAGKK